MSISRTHKSMYEFPTVYRVDSKITGSTNRATSVTSTTTGVKVNDYKQKIRDGLNATGDYDANRIRLVKSKGCTVGYSFLHKTSPTPSSRSASITGFPVSIYTPTMLTTSAAKAKAIALSKLYSKLAAEQQHMNSLATLAEFGDVIRQFGAPAAAIVDLSNKRLNRLALARRGLSGSTVFKRTQWHKIVASTYLEYAFGLAPLISDTKKAAEALARLEYEATGEAKFRSKVVARGEDTASTVVSAPGQTAALWIVGNTVTKDTSTARHQYVCGLKASHTADFGSNERLLQLLGITPENLIPAAWEAIPWSWLADYFLNIQNILQAAVTSTASVQWVCQTISSQHTREVVWSDDMMATYDMAGAFGYYSTRDKGGTPASYTFVKNIVQRRTITNLGVPPLVSTLPSEVGKLANMAAVLFSRKAKSSALWLF